jgi:hypothetical protein
MKLKSKDIQKLTEAYLKVIEKVHKCECNCDQCDPSCPCDTHCECKQVKESDESFFRDKPEPSKDEKEQAMAHLQTMSYILNDVGSRLSSAYRRLKNNGTVAEEIKKMLAKDGEELVIMSSEIEDIYEKYLSTVSPQ